MDWLISNDENVFELILKAIGFFSIIASMTPNETDNKIADFMMKAINMFGFNFGRARNE